MKASENATGSSLSVLIHLRSNEKSDYFIMVKKLNYFNTSNALKFMMSHLPRPKKNRIMNVCSVVLKA